MDVTIYAALLLTALSFFLLPAYLRSRKFNPPPGPIAWPIIGNLNLMGPLPHRALHRLAQKYGPIMQMRFGSFPVVIGSSAEMAKTFLTDMDANFSGRPSTATGKYLAYNNSDLAWSQYGPYWRQARKWFATELFSRKRMQSSECIRKEETRVMIRELHAALGTSVVMKDCLANVSLNVISRMVLGRKFLVNDVEGKSGMVSSKEFREMIVELLYLGGVLNIGDSIPWVDFLDLQGYVKRMKSLSVRFDRFLEHVLDEHNERRKNEKDNYVAKDFVDVLLQLADDPDLEVKIERRGVKSLTLDLLAGGTESSAVNVEWALSELLRKPELFEKATEELDRIIGRNRWVDEDDMQNLPYIQAIVKETMRLHPGSPLLAPRKAREDCKIGEYDIAKGTRVFVNVWGIGRDPALWEDPNEFIPERFIGRNIDVLGTDFELLPFGAGRRMCPGYALGSKIIESSLANLLHGFNWKLPNSMLKDELNMEEIFGLSTPRKIPLVAVPEARLPPELYYFK